MITESVFSPTQLLIVFLPLHSTVKASTFTCLTPLANDLVGLQEETMFYPHMYMYVSGATGIWQLHMYWYVHARCCNGEMSKSDWLSIIGIMNANHYQTLRLAILTGVKTGSLYRRSGNLFAVVILIVDLRPVVWKRRRVRKKDTVNPFFKLSGSLRCLM